MSYRIHISQSLVNKLFLQKTLYHLRMDDGNSIMKHQNFFNALVSQLVSIEIKMEEEYKCISLLCSFTDSWNNMVVAIGSTAQSPLKFEDVVAF
jgi:hypothetical protein